MAALDDYRYIRIAVDTANDYIPPVVLSGSDHDGRIIRVTLTNGGETVPGTGLSARLLFNPAPLDGESSGGYATMEAVAGAPSATWELPVPSEALVAGVGAMGIEVTDTDGGIVCTRTFQALVERPIINDGAPEAQDALREFREAVARLDDIDVSTAPWVSQSSVIDVAHGGTGATTATAALTALGAASSGDVDIAVSTANGASDTASAALLKSTTVEDSLIGIDGTTSTPTDTAAVVFHRPDATAVGQSLYTRDFSTVKKAVTSGLIGYVDSNTNIAQGTEIAADTAKYCNVNLPSGMVPIGVVALATTTPDSYLTYTLVYSGTTCYVRVMNRGATSITCGGGGVRVWYVDPTRI